MRIEENENMGDDTLLNFPSSGMNTNSVSVWDPIVSLSQNDNFGSGFGIRNQAMVHYQTESDLGEMVRKFPSFESGSYSEMVGSFGITAHGQISIMARPQNHSKGEQQVSENGGNGKSPCGKGKKRGSETNSPQSHSKGEHIKEISDEKRQKIEHNSATNLPGKQSGKQMKDDSNNAKEDYIHVRARRGQATNSHSLAERVRRERISERMKLLQDLVPSCNKITGKAVMLDEIINYVQSLQQQVEFLSMKLATVNPEINIDIDKILSKELLHMRGGDVAMPGFGPSVNFQHPYHPSMSQGPLSGLANASPFHQLPQNMWDSEILWLLQMGFDSNSLISNNPGSSGIPKLDI